MTTELEIQDLKNMLELSILAYNIDKSQTYTPKLKQQKLFEDISKVITFIPSLLTQARTISLISNNGKTLYLSFAGTHDVNDSIKDLDFVQILPKFQVHEHLKLHRGFYEEFEALAVNVKSIVEHFVNNDGRYICLTGHSSGGCVASIVGYYIKQILGFDNVKIITFGSPYFTNWYGAKWFAFNTNYIRVEVNRDPIPNLPKFDSALEPYVHVEETHIFIKNHLVYTVKPEKPVHCCAFIELLLQLDHIRFHRTAMYKNKLDTIVIK